MCGALAGGAHTAAQVQERVATATQARKIMHDKAMAQYKQAIVACARGQPLSDKERLLVNLRR